MIDKQVIEYTIGIKTNENFNIGNYGLSNSNISDTLTFCDNEKYINEINNNLNIVSVITTKQLSNKIINKRLFIVDDPRFDFYTIINYLGKKNYKKIPTSIGSTSKIHKTAFINEFNVIIGENVIIEPNVSILADVEIGDNCIIRAGTVIGCEGFEHKRTSKGILSVFHDGKIIIKNNVEIGSNTAIAKGFTFKNTIIDEDTRIDNLVHISHGVTIGKRCFLIASCMIAGSVTIQDDVWIGPNANITPGILIEENAFVSLGSVVTKNVKQNEHVTGNFAIEHSKFIQNFKKNYK